MQKMKGDMPLLSDGEFEIMECVWDSEEAPTQTGIMRMVNERFNKTLKIATIATYIRRIIWKGYLKKVDKNDGHPRYYALVSKDDYFDRTCQLFVERWGSEGVTKLILSTVNKFNGAEKAEALKMLDKIGTI